MPGHKGRFFDNLCREFAAKLPYNADLCGEIATKLPYNANLCGELPIELSHNVNLCGEFAAKLPHNANSCGELTMELTHNANSYGGLPIELSHNVNLCGESPTELTHNVNLCGELPTGFLAENGEEQSFNPNNEHYAHDITEIAGADSLYESCGIIRESEKNAEKLFKTGTTVYSTCGSTLCIQTMVYLMKIEKRKLYYIGNPHRAFFNTCKLLGVMPEKLEEDLENNSIKFKEDSAYKFEENSEKIEKNSTYNSEKLEKIFSHNSEKLENFFSHNSEKNEKKLAHNSINLEKNSAVYITSPDYFGNIIDVKKYKSKYETDNVKILVDNAHGAHLAFYEESRHPIHLGADLVCDSAHKMLPALTGAAYLHSREPNMHKTLKDAMAMFGTTSPSYLILQSLDLCNVYLEKNIRNDIKRTSKLLGDSKIHDCYHMVIKTIPQISEHIVPEFMCEDYMILLFSPYNTNDEIKHVLGILSKYDTFIDINGLRLKIPEYL
jgi:hypothetical protein